MDQNNNPNKNYRDFSPNSFIPPENSNQKNIYYLSLIITILSIILIGSALIQRLFLPNLFNSILNKNTPTPTITETMVPPTFTMTPQLNYYENTLYKFSLRYPLSWLISENKEKNSILFYDPELLQTPNALFTAQLFCVFDISETTTNMELIEYLEKLLPSDEFAKLQETKLALQFLAYEQKKDLQNITWTKLQKNVFKITCQNEPKRKIEDQNKIQSLLDSFKSVLL